MTSMKEEVCLLTCHNFVMQSTYKSHAGQVDIMYVKAFICFLACLPLAIVVLLQLHTSSLLKLILVNVSH